MQVTTVGLDLAKRVFQVHGVDAVGQVIVRRKLQRAQVANFFAGLPPCLVGIEACATAHHWARLIGASGHQVRLIPPSYVKPYVRRGKTDAADAEAICEAVGRPSMRFVPVKSTDQQAALLHHRARDLLVRQRTMLINALRGHLGEFGIIAPVGRHRVVDLISALHAAGVADVPVLAREALQSLIAELRALEVRIEAVEGVIMREHKSNAVSRRLATIPGIGPITASAIAATIVDPSAFKSGRELAAWIGLVPREHSSGGKQKLGRVSKQGDRYLRRLLTVGATAVMRPAESSPVPIGFVGACQQDGSDCLGGNGEAGALQNFRDGRRSLNLPHHGDREGDKELMGLRS
jgi:transposase